MIGFEKMSKKAWNEEGSEDEIEKLRKTMPRTIRASMNLCVAQQSVESFVTPGQIK